MYFVYIDETGLDATSSPMVMVAHAARPHVYEYGWIKLGNLLAVPNAPPPQP